MLPPPQKKNCLFFFRLKSADFVKKDVADLDIELLLPFCTYYRHLLTNGRTYK